MRNLFNCKYVINNVVNGYKLRRKITFFGLTFHETLDICSNKKILDESLKILGIDSCKCKNYPEN